MQGAGPITNLPVPSQALIPGTPTINNHFTVANYQETGQYGPSGESSTGSTQILVASKGRIRSFLKDGRIDNVLNLTHDAFFSPISLGGFTADPNVIFHPQWKQWIIFGITALHPSLVLAISDSDPITPDTVWSFYVVDTTSNEGFSASAFFDYATLGADERAIYLGANILDFNGSIEDKSFFISAAAYAIPRFPCGAVADIFAWRDLRNIGRCRNCSPFTFQPALNFDSNPEAGVFVSNNLQDALEGFSERFLVNLVTFDEQDVPTLSDSIEIPVEPYASPFSVSALGTPDTHMVQPVAGFRLAPTHIRNNRLWLVSNIGVNNEGVSEEPVAIPPRGSITRDAARFVQIDVNKIETDRNHAVVSEGTLFEATSTNALGARSFLTPAIMSNSEGKVIIGATTVAADERLNAAVAQLTNNNTAVGAPVLYTNSTSDYYATEDWEFNPFARWGDHTRISPDPEDPTVLWTAQQWVSDTNTWALEVAEVLPSNNQTGTSFRNRSTSFNRNDENFLCPHCSHRVSRKK
jgi:hypothetical protein